MISSRTTLRNMFSIRIPITRGMDLSCSFDTNLNGPPAYIHEPSHHSATEFRRGEAEVQNYTGTPNAIVIGVDFR